MQLKDISTRDKFRFAGSAGIWIAAWCHPSGGLVCEHDTTGQRVRFYEGNAEVVIIGEITDEEIAQKKAKALARSAFPVPEYPQ